MERIASATATLLFGLRCLVNVAVLIEIVELFASARSGLLIAIAIFVSLTLACLLLPIIIATVVCAVYYVRGSPKWRVIAMRIIAACLVCDLFFLPRADWIGPAVIAFDVALWALLAFVDARSKRARDLGPQENFIAASSMRP